MNLANHLSGAAGLYQGMDTSVDDLEYRLATRATQGDRAALEELVLRLRGPMFAVAFPICGQYDDAQDAVASALLRFCRHIGKLRDPSRAKAFLFQITRREALRLRQKRILPLPLPEEAVTQPISLLRLDIDRALKDLPASQARAIVLFYFEGKTIPQIARELERPEGTIKYWLHRGRVHLHTTLQGYGPMTDTQPQRNIAAIIATEFSSERLTEMGSAIRAAGWDEVRYLTGPAAFLQRETEDTNDLSSLTLHRLLRDCRFIALDATVGGHSAFALSHLIRSATDGQEKTLLLLSDGNRTPAENDATAMAAYVAGFDLLLMKPFTEKDLTSFARRALDTGRK